MRHLDYPIPAHRAAPFLSALVACGWIGRAEAIAALLHAAAPAWVSVCGRRTRLAQPPRASEGFACPEKSKAAKAAREALRPLLNARQPRRSLIAAASAAAKPTLANSEIAAITNDCIARYLREGRLTRRDRKRNGDPR